MSRSISPGMKVCPYCAEEIRAEAIKCRYCGEMLRAAVPPAPGPSAASEPPLPRTPLPVPEPEAPAESAPAAGPASPLGLRMGMLPATIYQKGFDLDTLPADVRDQARRHSFNRRVSVPLAIAASILTLNLFFVFNYAVKHGRLPKLTSNDPSPVMAVLLLFVPFVNLYWIYFMWVRLADRMNFQLRMRGEEPRVRRSSPITFATLLLAAMLLSAGSPELVTFAWAISWFVLVPLFVADLQSVINQLVEGEQNRT